jgi:hypothetical protein
MADTGAILIFVLKGTPTKNIRSASQPLTINLPDGTVVWSTHNATKSAQSQAGPCMARDLQSPMIVDNKPELTEMATFSHSVRTRANAVKFTYQSLCNPTISSLLKAMRRGFLKGCPNLNPELVATYLNPSPATAKGHMKRPKQCIWYCEQYTSNNQTGGAYHLNNFCGSPTISCHGPVYGAQRSANLIPDDESIANVFCFGAFADKISGVVYNELTGNFPFMSIDGCVCFFVMYHYETSRCIQRVIWNIGSEGV